MKKITCVIAHIDHGKTTLIDSLIASDGYISKSLAGELRYLDSRKDEQVRGITLKLTPIELSDDHIILDTPGHVDFEHLIFCSSIYSDNFVILIDVNEGITPRTYSLIKFVNKKRCILVLNKIEKVVDDCSLESILYEMNHLMGDDVFSWDRNNVILSSASLCAGICYSTNTFSKINTITSAFKAFSTLRYKIRQNDVENLIKKYKIAVPSEKAILRSVFPLHKIIFYCINKLNITIDNQTPNQGLDYHKFLNIYGDIKPSFVGICVYSLLKDKNMHTIDGLLHIVRIFEGKLSKREYFAISKNGIKKINIKCIRRFRVDGFDEIEEAFGPDLVCIEADIDKNTLICDVPVDFKLHNTLSPFFKSKIVVDDLEDVENIKDSFRCMSYTEQTLRVVMNKYCEFEVSCAGKVQYEKILNDLCDMGYALKSMDINLLFREFSTLSAEKRHRSEDLDVYVKILPLSEAFDHDGYSCIDTPYCNQFCIKSETDFELIESVLEIFTESGILINERVMFSRFVVELRSTSSVNIFNILKNIVQSVYKSSSPAVCPLFYEICISIEEKYLGLLYILLQKYMFEMVDENYDENLSFFVVRCLVPQFLFNDFVDELRINTKGTAYLTVTGSKFLRVDKFRLYVDKIRKQKGLLIEEVIIDNPNKQRTLKK